MSSPADERVGTTKVALHPAATCGLSEGVRASASRQRSGPSGRWRVPAATATRARWAGSGPDGRVRQGRMGGAGLWRQCGPRDRAYLGDAPSPKAMGPQRASATPWLSNEWQGGGGFPPLGRNNTETQTCVLGHRQRPLELTPGEHVSNIKWHLCALSPSAPWCGRAGCQSHAGDGPPRAEGSTSVACPVLNISWGMDVPPTPHSTWWDDAEQLLVGVGARTSAILGSEIKLKSAGLTSSLSKCAVGCVCPGG